jgi:MraZ protein
VETDHQKPVDDASALLEDDGLWGEFEHQVDDKGRTILPIEWRGRLGETFVVTRGPDRTLLIFPVATWRAIADRLSDLILLPEGDLLQRLMGGRALVKLDPQSRMAIPRHLREWAQITPSHTVVMIGQGRKIELFCSKFRDKFDENLEPSRIYEAADVTGLVSVLRGAGSANGDGVPPPGA